MGLDITAYSKLKEEGGESTIDEEYGESKIEGAIFFYENYEQHADRMKPLKTKTSYSHDKYLGFRAGAYSGYSSWRNDLAKLAGYSACEEPESMSSNYSETAWHADGGPFWELINFSDCEGTIGTDACKKLLKDFEKYKKVLDSSKDSGPEFDYFVNKYDEWHKAVSLAANDGAIVFH
jgi:hypothetical protein